MTNATKVGLGLCLVLVLGSPGASPASSNVRSKAERIEELLELTGAGDLGVQVMNGMLEQMKQTLPQVPAEWWDRFTAKVDPDGVNRLVIPVYEKHFTDEEIDALIEFYRTPLGQSIVSKTPTIMQESMAAGQAWGESLAQEILRDLEAEGYELPPGLQS